ncbi:MAG: hypothetical protein LBQ11_02985 [Candidatus Nomurabacteria bacterium]|jgi:hypothetical protein|nr:hypothetical protein [Candidatus Nomurabacteria bacterium]
MIKKVTLVALPLVMAVIIAPTALAADYTIIVSNSDVTLEQGAVVFIEEYIAPGFKKDYEIRVENRANVRARIVLDKIEKITPSNPNLAEAIGLKIAYNGKAIAVGKYDDTQFANHELICVDAKSEDVLALNINFPKELQNEYQGDSFKLKFDFKLDDKKCKADPKPPQPPDSDKRLPNTGQSQAMLTFLYYIIGLSFITTVTFAFLVLFARLRDKDDDYQSIRRRKTRNREVKR